MKALLVELWDRVVQGITDNGFEAGAATGLVTFHDALYVPGSLGDDKPFAADVLTVHQKGYYDSSGQNLPNDYDSPNPVAFLTVRPQCRLLLALSGPAAWTELAAQLLTDALKSWGVGGKTAAGYGIGRVDRWKQPERRASRDLADFEAWLSADTHATAPQRQRLQEIDEQWSRKLVSLSDDERQRAINEIRRAIKSPKLARERDELLARITRGNDP